MKPEPYPLFVPPTHLAEKGVKAWTKSEAEEYAKWVQAGLQQRVADMLAFLDVTDDDDPRRVLSAAGTGVAQLLQGEPFSRAGRLTDLGRALAADMGLLAARFLLHNAPEIRWHVVRRPKSDMSYNLPVLRGFRNGLPLDPVGGSIAEAAGLLRGNKGPDAWLRIYDWWIEKT
jgi:hypothetical protein